MLESPLNKLQILSIDCFYFFKLSQTESTPKHFFRKKALGKGISKAIPLQTLTGPECFRRLRLPDFKTIGT
jgi:hypothetical protein